MKNEKYFVLIPLLISAGFVLFLFVWQGNKGFSLWDEGFLWYGVQRVLVGEVPTRDFMAYEPGRYYWSAAIMGLLGDNGIMSLRAAAAIFQWAGLFTGLLLISRTLNEKKSCLPFLLISGIILALWMFPRHKLFDISLSIFLIGALTYLIENPSTKGYFIAGCCVGLTAVFGRNHGLYGAVGSMGVLLWLSNGRVMSAGFFRSIFYLAAGIFIGFTPLFLMMLFVPGFAAEFLANTLAVFERGETNLPLPVPWPWRVDLAAPLSSIIRNGLVGLFFVALLIFGPLSIGWVVFQKIKKQSLPPVLISSAFLSLPYTQFAFSRADVGHLAQGIFPLLIGLLVIFSGQTSKIKWLFTAGLCIGSLWVAQNYQPGWQCLVGKNCVDVEISGNTLQVDPGTKSDIDFIREFVARYAPEGQNIVVTPFWPGAYPLLERRSPIWEVYALTPRSESFEAREIERIMAADPVLVIVLDIPLDGREELRYKNTHPLTYQYILDNYEFVPSSLNPSYQIFITGNAEQ